MRSRIRYRSAAAGDDGLSMVELSVSMSLMAVVTLIFVGAVTQVYRGTHKADTASAAQERLNIATARIDRDLRYASAISQPASAGGYWYAEWVLAVGTTTTCHALRVSTTSPGALAERTWSYVPGAATASAGPWTPLADQVSYTGAPFTRTTPDDSPGLVQRQQLRVKLTVHAGSGSNAVSRAVDVIMTARNTSAYTDSDNVCSEGRTA